MRVATFFEPLLDAHDTAAIEVFCYYNQPRGDEVTERIRARAEHFLPVSGMGDRPLAERIRQDGIDILVDLTGHTADNRLPLFFLRPAPVQVTWLGYLGGTGVPTIDWRLTDVHADPETFAAAPGLEKAVAPAAHAVVLSTLSPTPRTSGRRPSRPPVTSRSRASTIRARCRRRRWRRGARSCARCRIRGSSC